MTMLAQAIRKPAVPPSKPQAPPQPSSPRSAARLPRLSGRSGYSLFVGFLKFLLPALAVGLVLLIIAWPNISLDGDGLHIGLSDLMPKQADSLSMINARFTGLDENNRPYSITADVASQAGAEGDLIELQTPKADITLQDGTWLALTADAGRYDRENETIDLWGDVNLFHDDGFEASTAAAHLDLNAGAAEGSAPVTGHGPTGTLKAEGFRILDRGGRVLFTGQSRLVLFPGADEGRQ